MLFTTLFLLFAQASALLKGEAGSSVDAIVVAPSETEQDASHSSLNPSFFWPYDYLQKQSSVDSEVVTSLPVAEHSVPAFIKSALTDEVQGHDLSTPSIKLDGNKMDFGMPVFKKVVVKTKHQEEVPKKESKEIPVYVYEMPPIPELKFPEKDVKEIPIYVYEMPPFPEFEPLPEMKLPEIVFEKHVLPEMKPLDLPKIEPVKHIPIVLYEFPPTPEMKPLDLTEMKFPEFRIEKYVLPRLPEFKPLDLPEMEPIEEIPIVMYELPPFPETKPIPEMKMPKFRLEKYILPPLPEMKMDLPKFDLPEEIPIVMYELPEMKPVEFKMPEFKVVKYQMESLPEAKQIEWPKLPEMKVVKYHMPPHETKQGNQIPEFKMPEVRYVKYQMPPKEKIELPEFKVPDFKMPEIKVVKYEMPEAQPLPEFKMPEIKPMPEFKWPEMPKLPEHKLEEFKFPEYQHIPTVQYAHAPAMVNIPIPIAYNYPMVPIKSKGFGYPTGKIGYNHMAAPPQYFVLNNQGFDMHGYQGEHGQNHFVIPNDHHHDSAHGTGKIGIFPGFYKSPYKGIQDYHHGEESPKFYFAAGPRPVVTSDDEVAQYFVSDGNNVIQMDLSQQNWLKAFQDNIGSFQEVISAVPEEKKPTPTSEL